MVAQIHRRPHGVEWRGASSNPVLGVMLTTVGTRSWSESEVRLQLAVAPGLAGAIGCVVERLYLYLISTPLVYNGHFTEIPQPILVYESAYSGP